MCRARQFLSPDFCRPLAPARVYAWCISLIRACVCVYFRRKGGGEKGTNGARAGAKFHSRATAARTRVCVVVVLRLYSPLLCIYVEYCVTRVLYHRYTHIVWSVYIYIGVSALVSHMKNERD